MKCICGYEFETEHNKDKHKIDITKGDERFVEVKGTFYIEGSDYYRSDREVQLFACPKCGTVRMEKW